MDSNALNEGLLKGEVCNRNGCAGVIEEHEKDGCCSCHISAPCSYCTTDTSYCPVCGWDAEEEMREIEEIERNSITDEMRLAWENEQKERLRLDDLFYKKYRGNIPAEKLEVRYRSHTHFSMVKFGVFPKGTETEDSLLPKIRGTFGGRFTRFNDYSFEYIAYTD